MRSLLVVYAAAITMLLGTIIDPVRAEDFTVIALPDTQNYSESYPQIYAGQTQWTADNAVALNIRFVTHLGDIVNNAATAFEWDNAEVAMQSLDASGIPYGTCVGNHDIHYPGDYYDPDGVNYLAKFDPANYAAKTWFGGASPSGLSNYQTIQIDGQDYLFLHLLIETPAQELAWAQDVLNANQDKATWVSTHRYLFDWSVLGAGRYDEFNYTFEPPYRDDGISADNFFHNFVAANRQIYMVYCGHNHSEYRQTSTNNFGLTVHEVLADYQDDPNGGNGWLRINTFRPDAERIDVESYSPYLDESRTGDESQFSLAVDFDAYTSGIPFLSFQQGVAGYSGMQDTYIDEDNGGSSYGASSVVTVDNDTANSWWGDHEGQGLFKFGDLFQDPVVEGDPAPTRIPYDAAITSATMTLTLSDDTDACHPDFYVYRLTRDWNESSTWNSLGNGISIGSETQPGRVASFSGDNDPNSDYGRAFDVTSSVQAWSDGEPNHGFVIVSEDLSFCDDGIDIYSSEHGTSAERPKLTVEFTYSITNVAPAIIQALTATPVVIDEGEDSILSLAAEDPNPLDPLIFWLEDEEIGYATGSGSVDHAILFEEDGVYAFSARVEDDETTVSAGNVTVVVNNLPPVILELTENMVIDIGRRFDFHVLASDPGAYDEIYADWDLNDDATYDDFSGSDGTHWYETPGSHTVRVSVTDDDGGETIGEFIVDVQDLVADGDFDNDGTSVDTQSHVFIDTDDETAFHFCNAGSGMAPIPPPPYDPVNCLSAFDIDGDGDVDNDDHESLLGNTQAVPVPAIGIIGLFFCLLVLLSIGVHANRWYVRAR